MNIEKKENELFEKWKQKYKTFVIDGCPQPDIYKKESRKVIFVLKDANLGNAESSDISSCSPKEFNQRKELSIEPNEWWVTIARWAYFLHNKQKSWSNAEDLVKVESIREMLSHHCFIQLKKTWGVGEVKNKTLTSFVKNDKTEIFNQILIYQPDFIIACGNGEHLSTVFDCKSTPYLKTSAGVGYWKVKIDNKNSILVDYCHPSIRCGKKVEGLIAKGLNEAILEIENTLQLGLCFTPQ